MTRLSTLLSCLLLLLFAGSSFAAEGDPTISAIKPGFGGRFKVGYWVPIEVSVQGGNEAQQVHVQLLVPDGDGIPTRITSAKPVAVAPGKSATVTIFAKIGQINPEIEVRLIKEGLEISGRTFSPHQESGYLGEDSTRPLVLTVGNPLGVSSRTKAEESVSGELNRSTLYHSLASASEFPTRWYGYESADAVVLCTSNPEMFRQLLPSSAQIEALDQWIQLGGKLVFSVGSRADEVLAAGSPLARFLPGTYAGMTTLRRANAWESYAETTDRLDIQAVVDTQGELRFEVPKLENVRGTIEAFDGARATDLPLVIRTAHGLGEIVFVAADLDKPPFARWPAQPQLLRKLLGHGKEKPAEDQMNATQSASAFGYEDLSGQLRSALEQFQGVRLVPFSLVAFLIILYILAIGPVDYLLLRRGFKRMEWTWFTFPAIVLAFSALAYVMAYWLKGDQLLTNQVDVVDYDTDTNLVRGTTWSNIFSPRVDSYDLKYRPILPDKTELQHSECLMSWMGLPGTGFGGMSAQTGGASLFTSSYAFSRKLSGLEAMPIGVWSTKGTIGRWNGTASSPIVAELKDRGDKTLSGTIQSRLDEPLTDCVLVYDRWAYSIGKLEPRARLSVDGKLDPQTVETYFKNYSLYNQSPTASTYDRTSLDVPKIIETMMFYNHLGGSDYTKLSNQYQQFVDLSSLLRCGRAILIGRGAAGGGQLLRGEAEAAKPMQNERDQHWRFYRFVFPVAEKNRG